MGLRQDRLEVLTALHTHLLKNTSISTAQLVAAAGRSVRVVQTHFKALVMIGLLRAQGTGPKVAYVWAETRFKSMTADQLEAEVERREAAAAGKPIPPLKPTKPAAKKSSAKSSPGKTPARPTGHPAHEWVQHVFDYEQKRKPGQPGYWED